MAAILAAQLSAGAEFPAPAVDSFQQQVAESSAYMLGPGDHVMIDVMDADELGDLSGKELQVSSDGYLNVPTIGRIRASGLTMNELQVELIRGLKKYVREPHIFVNVTSVRSKSVSVIGAVKTPGVQQLDGPKTIAQVVAAAGGFSTDAGYEVMITRELKWGLIPLSNAVEDASGRYSTAHILAKDLTDEPEAEHSHLPGRCRRCSPRSTGLRDR